MGEETLLSPPPRGMSERTRLALLVLLGVLSLACAAGIGYLAGARKAQELGRREIESFMGRECLATIGLEKVRSGSIEAAEKRCAELLRLVSSTEMKWGEIGRAARMAESSLKSCQIFSFVSHRKTLQDTISEMARLRKIEAQLSSCEEAVRGFKKALPRDDEVNIRSAESCLETIANLKDMAAAAALYNEAYQRILEKGCAAEGMSLKENRDATIDQLRRAALLMTLANDVDPAHEAALEEFKEMLSPPAPGRGQAPGKGAE